MSRYDIVLNKKPKKKITNLFKKSKGQKEKPKSITTPQQKAMETGFLPPPNTNVGVGITTATHGTGHIGMGTESSASALTWAPQRGVPLAVSSQEGVPLAVYSSQEMTSVQGPTSQHVLIAGPDGHRLIIPLRRLRYTVSRNSDGETSDIIFTIPTEDASRLYEDIRGGMQRQERNQRS